MAGFSFGSDADCSGMALGGSFWCSLGWHDCIWLMCWFSRGSAWCGLMWCGSALVQLLCSVVVQVGVT